MVQKSWKELSFNSEKVVLLYLRLGQLVQTCEVCD